MIRFCLFRFKNEYLLLSHDNCFDIVTSVDYRNRCVDVLFIINMNLTDGRHNQMSIANFPFDDSLWEIQGVNGSIHNILKLNHFPANRFGLQVLARLLMLNNMSKDQVTSSSSSRDLCAISWPTDRVDWAERRLTEFVVAVSPLKNESKKLEGIWHREMSFLLQWNDTISTCWIHQRREMFPLDQTPMTWCYDFHSNWRKSVILGCPKPYNDNHHHLKPNIDSHLTNLSKVRNHRGLSI